MDPSNRPPAKEVGNAFVDQYYFVMEHWPEEIYRTYKDDCEIGRRGKDGILRKSTFSETDANDLNTISAGGFDTVEITSVDSHYVSDGKVLVQVRGCFDGRLENKFFHTLFLDPQENRCLVFYDHFRFVNTGDEFIQDSRELTETICIKKLPPNATKVMVNKAFKKFGAIKTDGIIIRNVGINYGFVEFKDKYSAEIAIKASPVKICSGHKADVEMVRGGGYLEHIKITEEELRRKLNRSRREKLKKTGVDDFLDWHKLIIEEVGGTKAFDFWSGQKSLEEEQSKPQEIEEEQNSSEEEQSKPQEIEGEQKSVEVEQSKPQEIEEVEEEQKSVEEQSKPQEIEEVQVEVGVEEEEEGYVEVEVDDEEDDEEDGFYIIN